jgi:hypothetical protein
MRCSKCVLTDTTPGISLDSNGVCNYCKSYKKFEYRGEDNLIKLLESQKKKNRKYDCIVSLSGGRDSSYTLLKMVKDYGLKVLAVNYENPFTDSQAKENILNAVEILSVDLVSFDLSNVHKRTFNNNFCAWIKKPHPSMVPMVCIGCKNMMLEILRIARRYDIRCIVNGGNPFEDSAFKKVLLGVDKDESCQNTFTKALFGIINQSIKNRDYFKPVCLSTMVTGYFFGDQYTLGSRIYGHNITKIDLFHYIEWNENEVMSRISSEINWKCPEKFISPWRFDCKIGHLKDLMYMKTLGFTEKDDFYSKMIREGSITRDEAIIRLEKENKIYDEEIISLMEIAEVDLSKYDKLLSI